VLEDEEKTLLPKKAECYKNIRLKKETKKIGMEKFPSEYFIETGTCTSFHFCDTGIVVPWEILEKNTYFSI
jgi:hypothetical protein